MTTSNLTDPFAALPRGHGGHALLRRLLLEIPARAAELSEPVRVVAELRGSATGDSASCQRLYVSLQTTGLRERFDAITLHWSAATGACWDRFPADPRLPSLAPALARYGGPQGVEVLRYVPLRRLTFRNSGRVVKVKRDSRLQDSWSRARAVEAAARHGGLRVPRLLHIDNAMCAYVQADVPGSALSELAVGPDLIPLLAEAGGVHAELHGLDAPRLPTGAAPRDLLAAAQGDSAWAATVLPDLAGPLRRAVNALAERIPPVADNLVTCHGDLIPSHLIGASGDWTVIDHDLAHLGEAARDLAMFVAGLAYDVPALADGTASDPTHASAVDAYLDGYRASGGRVDERRLAWHLLAAHVHHAGLLATKDRAHPAAVAGTAARLSAAVDRMEATR